MRRHGSSLLLVLFLFLTVALPSPWAQTPPPAATKPGRILGIGGIFFKSADPRAARAWYRDHLGLVDKGGSVVFPWRERENPQREHSTIWTVFPASTKYFEPSPATFMVNYIVDDLDALLERLQREGVKIDPKRQEESYGKFAWIFDADGNKVELWQPLPAHP